MKKTMLYMILFCCLLSVPAVAQTRIAADASMRDLSSSNRHFTRHERQRQTDSQGLMRSKETGEAHLFGFYALGGYGTAWSTVKTLGIRPGGYDTRLGVLYEYRKGFFMLQTGLGGAWRQVRLNVEDVTYTNTDLTARDPQWQSITDSWGMPVATLTYNMTERTDMYRQFSAQLPVLAGFHIRGFFVMGGVTVTFPLWQQATASMFVTSRGSYDRFYGVGEESQWLEMDNHGYRENVPLFRQTNAIQRSLDLLVTLETGYEHRLPNDILLRLGAYADMGVLNFSPRSDSPALDIPFASKWDFETFGATPVWFSDVTRNAFVSNFTVGAKLTVLFTVKQKERCILCGSTKPNRHYH